jgi:hypothetical protein
MGFMEENGSEESSPEVAQSASAPGVASQRFEHYELVTDEEGQPVELGRGAMGVTYKALDVNLRCPVTLKVISERYLGDQSARLRRTVLSKWPLIGTPIIQFPSSNAYESRDQKPAETNC